LRASAPLDNPTARSNATALRQKAKFFRRVASVPTSGGHGTNRTLVALAEKLDHEAAASEHPPTHSVQNDDQLFDFQH
jgi:hypothetical protein